MSTFETAHMDRDDRPVEECGVIGVSSPAGEQTAQLAFFGLFALQHRGNTALHFASAYGYSSLAKWLIEKGADDSIMNFSGLTCYDGVG